MVVVSIVVVAFVAGSVVVVVVFEVVSVVEVVVVVVFVLVVVATVVAKGFKYKDTLQQITSTIFAKLVLMILSVNILTYLF